MSQREDLDQALSATKFRPPPFMGRKQKRIFRGLTYYAVVRNGVRTWVTIPE